MLGSVPNPARGSVEVSAVLAAVVSVAAVAAVAAEVSVAAEESKDASTAAITLEAEESPPPAVTFNNPSSL